MKRLSLVLLMALFSINISAQNTPVMDSIMKENFKAQKKQVIKEALKLSEEESTSFWPLYVEYNEKMFEQEKILVDLVMENADQFDSLNDKDSERIWKKKMDNDAKMMKLEKKYFKKIIKVISGAKTLRYFQLENKIKSLNRAQMAVDIPLFNDNSKSAE